jgi:hypothetical protein
MLLDMETTAQEVRVSARGTPLHEPRADSLGTTQELLDLGIEVLAIAQEVNGLNEKDRLIRAALAWLRAAQGELDNDTGRWVSIGEAAGSVVARIPR